MIQSNRILKKFWNDADNYFLFEEHCFGTHFSANSIMEEEDVRKTFWRINNGDIVVDCGASYGNYTLPALSAGARVYAFEINEWISKSLQNNTSLNNFKDCIIDNRALWNKTGDKLTYHEENLSVFSFGMLGRGNIREVDTITIDDYFIPLGLSKINWFKIDVDGAELQVLEGAKKTINRFKPRLLIELHPVLDNTIPNNIRDYFASNFNRYSVSGPFPYIINKGETSHVLVSID